MSKALELLYEELNLELKTHTTTQNWKSRWHHGLSQLHHSCVRSLQHWTTVLLVTVAVVALLVVFILTEKGDNYTEWLVVEAALIVICTIWNVTITVYTGFQERTEFVRLLEKILKKLSDCIQYNNWDKNHFPQLECPVSPCCTVQWTLRDGQVYNVPAALLVKGDIILMRPGHSAPGMCKLIQDLPSDTEALVLDVDEVFSPEQAQDTDVFNTPRWREPLKAQKFVLLETPYLKSMRQLFKDSLRPASIVEHEKFLILSQWIERRVVPVVVILLVATNLVRLFYMKGHIGHWTEMLLTISVHAIVPLLPLVLPTMWLLINFYGQARVFTAFEAAKGSQSLGDDSFDTDSSISADEARVELQWRHVLNWFKSILFGRAKVVTRKINITHILGSVTSLCCVDKKGILSYPNPTPEKIFFLRHGQHDLKKQMSSSTTNTETEQANANAKMKHSEHHSGSSTWVEVLDVTSDQKHTQYSIHFDDPSWKQHLSSLKPLGLTILANTCNHKTAQWYAQFTDHVAWAGLHNEETVAVVNRRCLCCLAHEIGFSNYAMDIFSIEKVLGMYRQVSAEMTTKERLQRAKSFIQHKIPMPNMVSVVVKENISGSCQMLSQGTADILLSCCTDFWDGTDLTPLSHIERKKILDFYHRTSIGSYCTAFAYCPVRQSLIYNTSDKYIELPDDNHVHLNKSMSTINKDFELISDHPGQWDMPRSFSVDSLIDVSSTDSSEDSDGLLQCQCNQIFIGMVTMQYQARQDFIQLIDKLEGACIRFVHFSQENEVRSRVFAEKMGLEAGWNCHISLRSQEQYQSAMSNNCTYQTSQEDVSQMFSRFSSYRSTFSNGEMSRFYKQSQKTAATFSYSAPSIVNLPSSQVKFETSVKTTIVSPCKGKREHRNNEMKELLYHEQLQFDSKQPSLCEDVEIDGLLEDKDKSWSSEVDLSRQASSSYITENTEDSLAFGNRAKLPRGIENIRPHLRSIDNVPLLVNLFTDCTPEMISEMITIMQENGEVVLCVGSSVNMQNVPLFLKANCGLALEPMCPQMCVSQPASCLKWDRDIPTPLQLSSCLLSVMCPILISKDENISLIHLIAEARWQLMSMRNCFFFIMCCSISVTLAQVLASILLLPPVLSAQHILWLVLVVVPLLGLTMMGNPVDARVMSLATGKNTAHITNEMILQFIASYLAKFLPPVLVALFAYTFTLYSYCVIGNDVTANSTLNTSCSIYDFMYNSAPVDRTWTDKFSGGLVLAQNIFAFLLVLYFEVISISFIHWTDHIWEQSPATNKLWLVSVPLLFCSQLLFSICDTYIRNPDVAHVMYLSNLHQAVWVTGLIFPLILVITNELVKHREIKIAVRYQKRARLDFGTKLGMNSPF